jgi:hypothetical protein
MTLDLWSDFKEFINPLPRCVHQQALVELIHRLDLAWRWLQEHTLHFGTALLRWKLIFCSELELPLCSLTLFYLFNDSDTIVLQRRVSLLQLVCHAICIWNCLLPLLLSLYAQRPDLHLSWWDHGQSSIELILGVTRIEVVVLQNCHQVLLNLLDPTVSCFIPNSIFLGQVLIKCSRECILDAYLLLDLRFVFHKVRLKVLRDLLLHKICDDNLPHVCLLLQTTFLPFAGLVGRIVHWVYCPVFWGVTKHLC